MLRPIKYRLFRRKFRNECSKVGLECFIDTKRGKGDHFEITVRDPETSVAITIGLDTKNGELGQSIQRKTLQRLSDCLEKAKSGRLTMNDVQAYGDLVLTVLRIWEIVTDGKQ